MLVQWPASAPCLVAERSCEVIRINAAWIALEPLEMRVGVVTPLARVLSVQRGWCPSRVLGHERASERAA